jgi:hypothetical protein
MPTQHDGVKERLRKHWYKHAHKIVIGVAGGLIFILGVILIIIPGPPASLTIALGITVLATEFLWAARFLRRVKAYLKEKLPDAHGGKINWFFAKAGRIGRRIAKWLHEHLVKPLTPRRKRV